MTADSNPTIVLNTVPLIVDFAIPALMLIADRFPALQFRYRSSFEQAPLGVLADGVHIALRAGKGPDVPGMTAHRIGPLPFGIYGSQDYLARHGPISGSGTGHRLVSHDQPADYAPFDRWARVHLTEAHVVLRSCDESAQRFAIRSGKCAGFLPFSSLAYMPTLAELHPPLPDWQAMLWLLSPDAPLPPDAAQAIDALGALMARSLA
ncbi:MAG: hypothetical protein Q4G24_01285 [Paracoccus sp. (in: a-proteobacteria)]|uniref:LysR substrate-binding domain-containing protein n=1 Tax=Paracoccus sp. TaxID=267 RepID=UPI0026E07403|nr:LysR substrate-binding domain-containing protein [Paracoccus sp. (in: a-proteobacteria)]MDO5620083.1 hypothetical protein [Paracoccus sp. (in: a-proteobacteria)]